MLKTISLVIMFLFSLNCLAAPGGMGVISSPGAKTLLGHFYELCDDPAQAVGDMFSGKAPQKKNEDNSRDDSRLVFISNTATGASIDKAAGFCGAGQAGLLAIELTDMGLKFTAESRASPPAPPGTVCAIFHFLLPRSGLPEASAFIAFEHAVSNPV